MFRRITAFLGVGLIVFLLPSSVRAQEKPFQIALLGPPLQLVSDVESINGLRINLLYGVNRNVAGFDVGVINRVDQDLAGIKIGLVGFTDRHGKWWQANAINFASCSPSSFGRYSRRGERYGLSASSNPSSTKRRRTRSTVAVPQPTASAMRETFHAGPPFDSSAFNRICACLSRRTAALPFDSSSSKLSRSAASSVTQYR